MELTADAVWAFAIAFARIGAIFMLAPGFGEAAVPPRVRLTIALLFGFVIAPQALSAGPPIPDAFGDALQLLISESLVGLMLGAGARILMAALSSAGTIIGLQTGLAFAQTVDPAMGQAGAIVAVFLSLMGVTLLFATNLHHVFLRGIVASYATFPPGADLMVGDAVQYAIKATSEGFVIATQIAAPLIVFSLVFQLALGAINRLMPQVQIFFVALPAGLILGLLIVMISLSAGLLVWLDHLERFAQVWG